MNNDLDNQTNTEEESSETMTIQSTPKDPISENMRLMQTPDEEE